MFKIEGTKSQGCSYCDKFKLVNKFIDIKDLSLSKYVTYNIKIYILISSEY